MKPWIACIALLLLFVQVNATVSLDRCKLIFENKTGLENKTGQSRPANITYHQCVETCGGGAGEFEWTMFSQGFGAWLLPWFALIFQLPFGATDRWDNLASVFLAIGSPALAGYSLAITRLNSRWLSHQFLYLDFPNKDHIPLAVSALQHIPFRIDTSLLSSLIALQKNNRYWEVLGTAAKRTRQLSIPVAMNIVWVLVAFLLTIVDSFVDFNHFITVPGDAGYSIAIVWTYLLPLVIGWLYVGCQPNPDHLLNALDGAHNTAYVAVSTGPVLATQLTRRPVHAIKPSTHHVDYVNADEEKTTPIFNFSRVFIWSQYAEHILRLYKNAAAKAGRSIPVQAGANWMNNDDDRTGNEAEVIQYCMDPVHPSPVYTTSPQIPTPYLALPLSPEPSAGTSLIAMKLYKNAAAQVEQDIPVQTGGNWMNNDDDRTGNEAEVYCMAPVHSNPVYTSQQVPNNLTPYPSLLLSPEPYAGTSLIATNENPDASTHENVPRTPDMYDEAASPNHLTQYLTLPLSPEPSAGTSLIASTNENPDASTHENVPRTPDMYDEEATSTEVPEEPVFATEVFLRVVVAAILALGLQWGTTGASILIHLNTQPKGLGCRALTFLLYGSLSTVAFFLLLFSSIISHLVRPQTGQKRSGLKALIGCIAAGTRWLGKFIAIMNGFGILVSCTMQFAGVYDNCFCSSMVFRGKPYGFVSFTEEDIRRSEVYGYWIGGIVMAFGASGLYSFAIYVASPMV